MVAQWDPFYHIGLPDEDLWVRYFDKSRRIKFDVKALKKTTKSWHELQERRMLSLSSHGWLLNGNRGCSTLSTCNNGAAVFRASTLFHVLVL